MTNVLLTGAGGFLGSHVLQQVLHRTDWDVTVVDSFRHNGGTDRLLEAMADTADGQIIDDTRRRVRLFTHDLNAPINGRQLGQIGDVDYIVHAAARCSVDDSIHDPEGHVLNNIRATLTVLQAAREMNIERMVHVSTDEVYGVGGLPFDEESHDGSSPYAASKAASEDLVKAWARTYGIPATIMVSANLFGERQSQLAFIPKVIRQLKTGQKIQIHTGVNDRPAWRWYTYAPNVGEWIVDHLAAAQPDDWTLERRMLAGQMGIDVLRLTREIATIMDVDFEYEQVQGSMFRPSFDGHYGKLPNEDSWRPEITATEGLEYTVEWFLNNPRWLGPDGQP